MKKWITSHTGTQNGETLEIIFPFETNETNLTIVQSFANRDWFRVDHDGLILEFSDWGVCDSLKNAIKICKEMLNVDIRSLEDPRTAPPSNPELYIVKCKEALITLKEMYSEEYPEEFI